MPQPSTDPAGGLAPAADPAGRSERPAGPAQPDHPAPRIVLPRRPARLERAAVAVWSQPVEIETYPVGEPDPYPAYFERRVFQGSSGTVYPLPFIDRVSRIRSPQRWQAVHLENEFLRLMVLPELGGRIQIGQDRTNGYDFVYRNNVIKPALVGLAGPWISGGVEFNWPQHHRPATFLPVDHQIEAADDGSVTLWCSDHDPFDRMKGMHGVRLRPGSSVLEVRVRCYNRSVLPQTFLWWSNLAAAAGDHYQSFFPPDVDVMADHAKRATVTFPKASAAYYGVDYPARVDAEHPQADRIDWYRNIPAPTSYMCVGSQGDFFGGYDHALKAGFVAWADHRVAPGKKQWTWGNSPFGWAWDRQLTDGDGPYVELMSGAYTDNQPDFSFLAPGETKTFSQYWYPIRRIGPVQAATLAAALAVQPLDQAAQPLPLDGGQAVSALSLGAAVTRDRPGCQLRLTDATGAGLWQGWGDLSPADPWMVRIELERPVALDRLEVELWQDGERLVGWRWSGRRVSQTAAAWPADPVPSPDRIETVEGLDLAARHLEQYRHATRSPEDYLREALRRDPGDSRGGAMLAARRYRQGRFEEAAELARAAVGRLTAHNLNPYDGEPHYLLGLALGRLGDDEGALDALVKSAWTAAWHQPGLVAAARLELRTGRLEQALAHLEEVVARDGAHLQARDLLAVALRRFGLADRADQVVAQTLSLDPLDWWARDLAGQPLETDPQTSIDLVVEYLGVGACLDALRVAERGLALARGNVNVGLTKAGPLLHYYRAFALDRLGRPGPAAQARRAAREHDPTGCFLVRLDDVEVVRAALAAEPDDPRAHALLGHWSYHVGRTDQAQEHWRRAAEGDPSDAVCLRNLAMAAHNQNHDPAAAAHWYDRALAVRPDDAKLRFEHDQIQARLGATPRQRLQALSERPDLVAQRDDLTIQCAELACLSDRPELAVELLSGRQFTPWEGGEGVALAAWEHAHALLARRTGGRDAVELLRSALDPPDSLGEARHPLANASDLWLALGDALAELGQEAEARSWWERAADQRGDFQAMAHRPHSEMTYHSVLACRRLGWSEQAERLLDGLARFVDQQAATEPAVDYFATSLPDLMVFTPDLAAQSRRRLGLLRAQVAQLRGETARATAELDAVLAQDPADLTAFLWASSRPRSGPGSIQPAGPR
ncbi:MAG: DUF5107 domain-containing protein [Propionibacteriaceae bacterium]|nr:DUF5107 domain-containing protein [Propionibacteriaceae bacterium]